MLNRFNWLSTFLLWCFMLQLLVNNEIPVGEIWFVPDEFRLINQPEFDFLADTDLLIVDRSLTTAHLAGLIFGRT